MEFIWKIRLRHAPFTGNSPLYDLTNTYFEGRCTQNPKAQYGRSKEKRSDCGIVTLALVLDASGFPKKSKIYPGNVSEQATLKEMIETLEGDKQSIIVMDAGIATEKNIEWLQQDGYQYIVVSRKRNLQMPDAETPVILKDEKHNRVEAVLVSNEKTNELELYCHSQAKEAKTKVMVSKASKRYEGELEKLSAGLNKKGFTKKYEKVMERLGRLKEKNRKINALYDIAVEADEERINAIKLTWARNEASVNTKQAGIYCLRTNQKNLGAHEFWDIYTTLTDLEAAFRSLTIKKRRVLTDTYLLAFSLIIYYIAFVINSKPKGFILVGRRFVKFWQHSVVLQAA